MQITFDAQIASILEVFPDVLVLLGADGSILDYKIQTVSEFHLAPEGWQGKCFHELLPRRVGSLFETTLKQVLQTQTPSNLEYSLSEQQQQTYYEARIVPLRNNQALAIIRNISDHKHREIQLIHDALHDSLTGLPNRSLFMDRVEMAMQRLKRFPKFLFAVLFIDLDGFKQVNDQFGHGVGDQLLIAVSDILRHYVRANDTVARLGGDEFTILLDSVANLSEVCGIAERLQDAMKTPLTLTEHSIQARASIGIVLATEAYSQAADLLRDADIALYQAKDHGKGQYAVFEP
jgi:diguanylate cyclase (GGDEF)-like protein